MPDDFKDEPLSIGEIRAAKSADASNWSPREALVSLLRNIDRGEVSPDVLVISYRDNRRTWFTVAGPDAASALGVMEIAKHRMLRDT